MTGHEPGGPAEVGAALTGVVRTITQEQVEAYARAAGDFNPVLLDADFDSKTPFGRRIAHGMLTLAIVSEMLTSAYPSRWAAGGRLKVRFREPVFPGDTVVTFGEVVRVREDDGSPVVELAIGARVDGGAEAITGRAFIPLEAAEPG